MSAGSAPCLELEPEARAWATDQFVVSRGVRRLSVGARAVLFCERRQQLFELNAVAAAIWDGLADGRSAHAVSGRLGGHGLDEAAAFQLCADWARHWVQDGWLLPAGVTQRLAGAWDETLDLTLDGMAARVELRLDGDRTLAAQLREVFGGFAVAAPTASPGAGDVRLDVVECDHGYAVLRDGLALGVLPRERVVPEVKAALTDALCRRSGAGGFLLHAALLEHAGRGLLLSGAPGAGKTTLAVALACRGFGYGSDDLVRVAADGRLSGVRFSPAVKTGGWPLLAPYAAELSAAPTHLRGDGQAVRYLPADRLAPSDAQDAAFVLLIERRDDGAAELAPLDPLEALTTMLGSAFSADHRLDGATLEALAQSFSRMRCHRVRYAQLADGVACVEGLVDA